MYVGALCDILANVEFIEVGAELMTNLDAHVAPGVSIERILAYRGPGHAVLHHALRGLVAPVRDLPIAARIYNELRPHGPQWVADVIAELSLPPETDLAPRIIPTPCRSCGTTCASRPSRRSTSKTPSTRFSRTVRRA